MLFNTHNFIFVFLPLVLAGFYFIGKYAGHRIVVIWLILSSLFFYGWWNPYYLGLILGSLIFNYISAVKLSKNLHNQKFILIIGISVNLILLFYFKYFYFFVSNISTHLGLFFNLDTIILPLAISFFTFQQITFLVDSFKGKIKEYNFLYYALFVTFFPQLIAGPIVHHSEMLPQFIRNRTFRVKAENLSIGITIFAIGLFKKVVLADNIAVYATPVFNAAEIGSPITFFDAWAGAFSYSFQLYFDFSGYSDMAVGLARMFGVRLPINFNSPYKATSIIEFWRRWHITLSRFLKNYLYIPLGGNRLGEARRMGNLMITMLLGGLWHGAGWTFLIWGGLHGLYLVVNHSIHKLIPLNKTGKLRKIFGWLFTMLAVVVAWVPFRAESLEGAIYMLRSMSGLNDIQLTPIFKGKLGFIEPWLIDMGVVFDNSGMFNENIIGNPKIMILWIILLIFISTLLPNTYQLMYRYRPVFQSSYSLILRLRFRWQEWRPNYIWSILGFIIFVIAIMCLKQDSEFLYFQF